MTTYLDLLIAFVAFEVCAYFAYTQMTEEARATMAALAWLY